MILKYDRLLSNIALNFNLRRYMMGVLQALEAVKVITGLGETMVGRCTLKPQDCHFTEGTRVQNALDDTAWHILLATSQRCHAR